MKKAIPLLLILILAIGCATLPEPDNDEATLLTGQAIFNGSGFDKTLSLLNGAHKYKIELTILNKELNSSSTLKANADGMFYSNTLPGGEYTLKKLSIQVEGYQRGAYYYMLFGPLSNFTIEKGKVNNLGVFKCYIIPDEKAKYFVNIDYNEVHNLYLTKYPKSAWLNREWITVNVHPEKLEMTSASKINIIWSGIYKAETIGEAENKKSPNNRELIINTPTRLKSTKIVPLQIGTQFGIIFEVIGESKGSYVNISKVVIFPDPGLKDPTKSELLKKDQFDSIAAIGRENTAGHKLQHDWELVPGEWKIQIWSDNKKYAEETFTLVVP